MKTAGAANDGSPLTGNDGTMPAVECRTTPNRKDHVGLDGHEASPLDFDAFRVDSNGKKRNRETARRSQTRAVDRIVSTVVSTGTSRHQSLALHKALLHPAIKQVAKSACFGPDQACWQFQKDNVIKIIKQANLGQAQGGRRDNIKSAFVTSLMVALASTQDRLNSNPSLRKQAQLLGLKVSTGWRYLSKAQRSAD